MAAITRRDALRILACAGAGTLLAWRIGGRESPRPERRTAMLLGTTVSLTVLGRDREEAAAAADATLRRMAACERVLTRHSPDGDVARLNRTGRLARPAPELLAVLGLAQRLHSWGEGAFDVTVLPALLAERAGGGPEASGAVDQRRLRVSPGEIVLDGPGMGVTLDGIGKGHVIDEGVAELRARGFSDVLVEAGGDLLAAGRRAPDRRWTIGVRHPRRRALLRRIRVEETAVATSGDTFQAFTPDFSRHHILDPRTGRSAPELASATVLAPTAALADGLATLAMVLGSRRTIALLEDVPRLAGCEALVVDKDGRVVETSGFPAA